MRSQNRTAKLRGLALLLVLVFMTLAFTGCATRKLPSHKEDLAVVGTVGEYEVLYEELRFLVLSYREQLENKYGKGIWESEKAREQYLPELKEAVYEDIKANYAVLTLAAKNGITVDGYAKEVQEYMDLAIQNDFNRSRSDYKEFLKATGLTDHYVRFTAAVDLVYEDLYFKYMEENTIPNADPQIKQYILQNFVRVASICIINKSDDEVEDNRKRAEQYREEVADGADILDYVKYTLDLSPEHCFGRGEMEDAYEKNSFALENVGDVSEVFLGEAEYEGVTRSAWYFVQKMDLTAKYVEDHYQTLFDRYTAAAMNEFIDAEKEALVFVPNEYGKSLDLLAIEPIESVKDNTWVFVLIGIGSAVLLVGGVVGLFCLLNQKPKTVKNGKKR